LRKISNTIIIGTTHSAVVINELKLDELLDIEGKDICSISDVNKQKLNMFMHPGRSELMLADNVILVEGYTEELLLKHYLYKNNYNWTVINVAGTMFEPYLELACLLNKRIIVISDNDRNLSKDGNQASARFKNLKNLCADRRVKILEVDNTLETDLYNNGFIEDKDGFLRSHSEHSNIRIAKTNKKTEIAEFLIGKDIDLTDWHIIRELVDELKGC
jgi:predicted ATP-dependent endonuclease of OLD family